jgi:2-hydroxychromene-2-carboxylate isomerase
VSGSDGEQPIFYYDLGSPACYLAAEQVMTLLPVVPEWEPVLARGLGAPAFGEERQLVEKLAGEIGLQPLRWPSDPEPDTRGAMLAATYAKHIGRAVAFSLACFRQAYAGGRALSDRDTALLAAAACEVHPAALIKGIGLRSVRDSLARATEEAGAAGITRLPAIRAGTRIYEGYGGIVLAARELEGVA